MRNALLGLSLLAAAAATPVLAQQETAGISSTKPVDISADEAEVRNEQRLTIWRGNVEAIQGQNRLRTPQLNVFYSPRQGGGGAAGSGFGAIERMEASGPVYFVTPTQTAKGDKGVYLAANDTITLTGDVVLLQNKNVVRGDRLVINQKTGQSTLVSNSQGRGSSNRVRGVFYPNQAQAGAPAASAPAGR